MRKAGSSPPATPENTISRQAKRSASSVATRAVLTLPIPAPTSTTSWPSSRPRSKRACADTDRLDVLAARRADGRAPGGWRRSGRWSWRGAPRGDAPELRRLAVAGATAAIWALGHEREGRRLGPPADRHRPPDRRRARPRGGARAVCAARLQLDPARPACRLGHGQLLHHVRARLSRAAGHRRRQPVHQRARPLPGGARGAARAGPGQPRRRRPPGPPGRPRASRPTPPRRWAACWRRMAARSSCASATSSCRAPAPPVSACSPSST